MKKRFLVFLFSIILSTVLMAQTDTLFWFAVPYHTTLHDGPLTADLTLTAVNLNKKTTVVISDVYGNTVKEMQSINQRLLTITFDAPSGIYILIIDSNKKKTVFRLVKN